MRIIGRRKERKLAEKIVGEKRTLERIKYFL